jgi:hypothetical protein
VLTDSTSIRKLNISIGDSVVYPMAKRRVFDHAALNYVGLRRWRLLWFERTRHRGTANTPKHLSQSGHEHMAYSNFSPLGF